MKGSRPPTANAGDKKQKRYLKFLFGGFTENQIDYFCCILIIIGAVTYTSYTVDWEVTVFPRSLSGIAVVRGGEVSSKPPSSAPPVFLVSPKRTSVPLFDHATVKNNNADRSQKTTLLLIHSELFDGHNPAFPPQSNLTLESLTSLGFTRSIVNSVSSHEEILHALYSGNINKVIWVPPAWSKHFLGQNDVNVKGINVSIGLKDGKYSLYSGLPYVVAREYERTNPQPADRQFELQVTTLNNLRRRKTEFVVDSRLIIDIDLSWVHKTDPVNDLLKALEVDGETRKYMRSFSTGYICFNETNTTLMLAQYQIYKTAFVEMFTKESIKLPRDMFSQRFAPSIGSLLCDKNKTHKILREFHFVLASTLNETHKDIVRTFGYPLEAGTTARLDAASDVDSAWHEIYTFLENVGLPTPIAVRVTDEWEQRSTHHLGKTAVGSLAKLWSTSPEYVGTNESEWQSTQGISLVGVYAGRPKVRGKKTN